MPYSLKFSDPTKQIQVTVPDMPPGVNTIDTSLTLVGRGYPNYGEKIAENFLHLLENFASPLPPENPIEGQLWYDTSDPNRKVLRIMDGTASATRWPNANGIYQQDVDPKEAANSALKPGDIWVDTRNNQLKIFNSNNWTLVGPITSTSITGPVPEYIDDIQGNYYWIIKNYVDGVVESIFSGNNFIPRSGIPGFVNLRKGLNIPSDAVFNGIAVTSQTLDINGLRYASSNFLRKNDASGTGQVITGKVVFSTPTDQIGSINRDGLIINNGNTNEFIQLYKYGNDALLLNYKTGGKIVFQTRGSGQLENTVVIEAGKVGINTNTNSLSATLEVYGTMRVVNTLTISSVGSNALTVAGGIQVNGSSKFNSNLEITGITTSTNTLMLGTKTGSGAGILPNNTGTYDLGSINYPFRNLYVSGILGTTGTVIYGSISGNANGLKYPSEFKLQGQVTATSFLFAGTGTQATFNATLTPSAVTGQITTTTPAKTHTLIVYNTSTATASATLQKISRKDFLIDVSFPGVIYPYAGSSLTVPTGWLMCDGVGYTTSTYSDLFGVIGYTYGGSGSTFNVPNMTNSTTATSATIFINYIIKT